MCVAIAFDVCSRNAFPNGQSLSSSAKLKMSFDILMLYEIWLISRSNAMCIMYGDRCTYIYKHTHTCPYIHFIYNLLELNILIFNQINETINLWLRCVSALNVSMLLKSQKYFAPVVYFVRCYFFIFHRVRSGAWNTQNAHDLTRTAPNN